MDIERTLETQRHRLLRVIAGLVLLLGVLAVGPVSRWFSDWTLGFVGSVLSRVEAAARYLVITQACLMVDQCSLGVKRRDIALPLSVGWGMGEKDVSLSDCLRRLRVLRSVLMDLPRHALRLLRRIAKQIRGATLGQLPCIGFSGVLSLHGSQQIVNRIERPPDKSWLGPLFFSPLPRYWAGGADGWKAEMRS